MSKEWFDPHNIEHCKAYRHLQLTDEWPEGFELHNVVVNGGYWQIELMAKMTKAWIDHMTEPEKK